MGWIMWRHERHDISGRGRQSQSLRRHDRIDSRSSDVLERLGTQVEAVMRKKSDADDTANKLAGQKQSPLSSIRDRQLLLIQHGGAVAGRRKASEDITHQLAHHQVWFDRQNERSRSAQEFLRCHVQDSAIEMRRLQEIKQQKANHVAIRSIDQEDIVREIHRQVVEQTHNNNNPVSSTYAAPNTADGEILEDTIFEGRRRVTGGMVNPVPPMCHDPWAGHTSNRERTPGPSDVRRKIPMRGAISDHPKFPAEAYGELRRYLILWRELKSLFEDGHLVGKLAPHSECALKIILIGYLKETTQENRQRQVEGTPKRLGAAFDRPNQDTVVTKIHELMNISRRPGGDIRLFWVRFGRVEIAVGLSDTSPPGTALYSRALQALRLSGGNRAVLLAGLGANGEIPTLKTQGRIGKDIRPQFR